MANNVFECVNKRDYHLTFQLLFSCTDWNTEWNRN